MKEYPISFSPEMVKAIMDGRKTQTRRVMRPQPPDGYWFDQGAGTHGYATPVTGMASFEKPIRCRYGRPGDRLWVKESWIETDVVHCFDDGWKGKQVLYRADCSMKNIPWKSPRFMPKRVSRILLENVCIRVERLQSIKTEDAYQEGFPEMGGVEFAIDPVDDWFKVLWNSLNVKKGKDFVWDKNPWVWVIEFRRIKP